MSALYQGRALRAERPPRRAGSLLTRITQVAIVLGAVTVLAHLPWGGLVRGVAKVRAIRVEGTHYLDAARVCAIAGVQEGDDLLRLDPERVRQRLLMHPRIAAAEVRRLLPRGLAIRVTEREPVLLVEHGTPWEVDSSGVLLAPLAAGEVADVPLLAGPRLEGWSAGTQVQTPAVRRGLAWAVALTHPALQLGGQVSQIGVADARFTELVLMNGTRVVTPAWPPGVRELSSLRVVLADLVHRGIAADQVDLRFHNQVIVTPVGAGAGEHGSPSRKG